MLDMFSRSKYVKSWETIGKSTINGGVNRTSWSCGRGCLIFPGHALFQVENSWVYFWGFLKQIQNSWINFNWIVQCLRYSKGSLDMEMSAQISTKRKVSMIGHEMQNDQNVSSSKLILVTIAFSGT